MLTFVGRRLLRGGGSNGLRGGIGRVGCGQQIDGLAPESARNGFKEADGGVRFAPQNAADIRLPDPCRPWVATRRGLSIGEAAGCALIERDAYQAGFAKGEQAGIRLGKESMAPVLDQLRQTLAELAGAREKMLRAMEPKIAALAVDIAEKIVHIEIDRNDEVIRATVREAIDQSTGRGEIDIFLAPSDLQVMEELRPELMEIKGVEKVRLLADERVSPGGCRIETSAGAVDATVETALREIRTLRE